MEESFSDIEKKVDLFLKQFDIEHHKVHDTIYCFEENEMSEIISLLHNCKLPKKYHSYKDVLQDKLFHSLELEKNDLVLCSDGIIYIKLFFQIESPEETPERRACGLSPEVLETYKQQFFPNDSHKEKIFALHHSVVEDILSFRKITPMEFKKVFIPVLINIVEIVVIMYSDLEDLRTIRGMTLYLLREVFDDLMLFIAEDILFNFSNEDRKAIEFLNFFSINETIDAHGKRHKPNPILDESNHAWNMTTIRSTMIQHKKSKQALYDKKNSLISIKKKLDTQKIEQNELSKQMLSTEKEIEGKITNIHKTLQKLQESDAEEVTFVENGKEKLFNSKLLMAKMFKKEDELFNQRTKTQRTIKELEHAIANKQRESIMWEKIH
ncbi:hypothetical protein SUSP_002413 [Sulfurospirillum sp. 'SP']|nr:hypothetical protein [Sulfurospirillum sp. 'SP']WNY99995.1 hypothetical protein SUSP_002413 [Sulfurospirillum sp. 'SP']